MTNKIFDKLFNELETYEVIPEMINKAVSDCVRSEFDSIKNHAVCYHISGIINIVKEMDQAITQLDNHLIILGIDVDDELEEETIERLQKLKAFLKTF